MSIRLFDLENRAAEAQRLGIPEEHLPLDLYRIPVSPEEHSALARRVEAAQREKHWTEPYYDRMAEKRRADGPIALVCFSAVCGLVFLSWAAEHVGWDVALGGLVIFAVVFYCWLFQPDEQ